MAIKKLKGTEATETTEKELKLKPKAEAEVAKDAEVKGQAGLTAEVPVEEPSGKVGSKSDKVAFVACLGDPSNPDTDTTTKVVTPTIVGYRFKALEDMDVPESIPAQGTSLKNNIMACDPQNITLKHVKAGETFDLTKFETGYLASQEEYNCVFSGNPALPVSCAIATKGMNKDGSPMKTQDSEIPTISLRAMKKGTSVKDVAMVEVLSFVKETQPNGTNKITRTINKGFEKFISLTLTAERSGGKRGANGPKTVTRNEKAVVFLNIVKAQSQKAQKAQK